MTSFENLPTKVFALGKWQPIDQIFLSNSHNNERWSFEKFDQNETDTELLLLSQA